MNATVPEFSSAGSSLTEGVALGSTGGGGRSGCGGVGRDTDPARGGCGLGG